MVKKENKIMNFFKPTFFKIVVSLIIFFVFVPIFSIDSGVRCVTEPCESKSTVSFLIYLFSLVEEATLFEVFYTNIITGIIVSYLISCLVDVFVAFIKEKTKSM
jgi:hypothetical protein